MSKTINELNEIKQLIVEKDPDDNDKFLRTIWDLVSQAEEAVAEHEAQVRRKSEQPPVIEIVKGYNNEKIDLVKILNDTGEEDFYKRASVRDRLEEVDKQLRALTPQNTDSV